MIFVDTNSLNLIDKSPTDDYNFIKEEINSKGTKVILVNINENVKKFKEMNNFDNMKIIEFLENDLSKIFF